MELKRSLVILNRVNGNRAKDSTTLMDTNREVVDKGDAGDVLCMKGCKCRMKNKNTWKGKKSKVSFLTRKLASLTVRIFVKDGIDFHIRFQSGKKRPTVKIYVKVT